MKRLHSMLHWFKLWETSSPASRALLVETARSLRKQFPILYAILAVNSVGTAYVLPPALPRALKFGPPGVLLFIVCIHLIFWLRLNARVSTAEEVLRHCFRACLVIMVLNAGALAWIVAAFDDIDISLRTPVSLLVFMGAVASAIASGVSRARPDSQC
jgi:predicted signal transduction protein with EAL and GGDEF domain